ncbi:MAG: hypothetical protein JNK82_33380 [Myxococcaceae bacterium]|nr:hypothetical protein [Myxococcaceae bacterium]
MRAALCLVFVACATAAPKPEPAPAAPAKPPPTEADLLRPKVAALEQKAAAVEAIRDDALWSFWLGGAPSTADLWPPELLDDAALKDLRRARELKAYDPITLDRLEALIAGERVGRAMRETEATIANLEASSRFPFEKGDVALRDLGSLLANEKNAARRQALWAASLPAVKQLDAALAKRDEAQREALAAVQLGPESFAALLRGADLTALATFADRFLLATEERWRARLAALKVQSRADLPAVLKPSGTLDAAFPKARIAERGTALLASLGLYGLPQLTLDLTDSPRKQPLPLTVSGVRLSFKPRGGWKDQQSLFAELGRALTLRHAPHARRRTVETSAALFGSLAWNRAWLEEQNIAATEPLALGPDIQLLALRRAAGALIADLDRAYALPDDPARIRPDAEALQAGAVTLRAATSAFALARHLETECGPRWWSSLKASEILKAFWQTGELPEPVRAPGESGEALLSALGSQVWEKHNERNPLAACRIIVHHATNCQTRREPGAGTGRQVHHRCRR